MLTKQRKKQWRHKRIKAKVSGTPKRPRLSVFRSNNHIYAQLVNDQKGKVLVSVSDIDLSEEVKKKARKEGKIGIAREVGSLLAEKASEKNIEKCVFDRGGYKYHGRVKAVAETAREAGLRF